MVEETIPIGIEGSSHNNAQRVLGLLRAQLRRGSRHGPIVWRMRPTHALFDAYTEVYGGTVEDTPGGGDAGIGPAEGGYQLDATITLRRAAFWGSDTLETLISAASSRQSGQWFTTQRDGLCRRRRASSPTRPAAERDDRQARQHGCRAALPRND